MWSTSNPPDVIEDTEPFYEIEDAFDIYGGPLTRMLVLGQPPSEY